MKYFLDTEFLEGTQKRFFNLVETKPTIDLISIGIVAEDGREYYAISKDFNLKEAWNRYDEITVINKNTYESNKAKVHWIRQNVLKPIFNDMLYGINPSKHDIYNHNLKKFSFKNFKYLISLYGKTNEQIAKEIKEFCSKHLLSINPIQYEADGTPKEFYTYYGDYDWVVFCWLFGKMINLPSEFPMYSIDLKQELDKKVINSSIWISNTPLKERLKLLKEDEDLDFPKQNNEHNALSDARWNKKLYEWFNNF